MFSAFHEILMFPVRNLKFNHIKNKQVSGMIKRYILSAICFTMTNLLPAQGLASQNDPGELILSVNAYSFNDLLSARERTCNEQVYTLFNLIDWCASQGIKALDATAYYFPTYPEVPSDEYLERIRRKAEQAGVEISGTGIRNNFASPDPSVRASGVALAKEWIVAASKMHAPVIRLFAGEIPEGYEQKWDEVAGWMIECFRECAAFGEKYGVKIGIQNHGDMLQNAEQCLKVINEVDSDWAGLIIDTGSFTTSDPYDDIELLIPHAVNWQVKEFTMGDGIRQRTDFPRLIRIIKKHGYKGYLPVETLRMKGQTYDPFFLVTGMLSELDKAIKAE